MPKLTLWGGATSRTLRAHWMLHELDLPYEKKLIASRTGETQTPEFTAINPRQKIPVLQDRDLALAESAAIVNYLASQYGSNHGFIPSDKTRQRALYDQWCFFITMELDAHTLYIMRKHRDLAKLYGDAPNAINEAIAGFKKQAAVAEMEIAQNGPFILGEQFTGADILLLSCLDWAASYQIPLSDTFDAYRNRLRARPAFQAAAKLNFSISPGM